jgi:hypothetical protein
MLLFMWHNPRTLTFTSDVAPLAGQLIVYQFNNRPATSATLVVNSRRCGTVGWTK